MMKITSATVDEVFDEHGIAFLPDGTFLCCCADCGCDWIQENGIPVCCPSCGKEVRDLPQLFIEMWERYDRLVSKTGKDSDSRK